MKIRNDKNGRDIGRREFLARTGVVTFALPAIVPSSVFGAAAPSNRINMGFIGVGDKGSHNMKNFHGNRGAEVVGICDVDTAHRERACESVGLDTRLSYRDYHDLLARSDIDAVSIATPDHWHVPISIAAVRAGKDVYCEKPLTLTIAEGRKLVEEVKRYGRVFQTGSQQRSGSEFRKACELVVNGRIGHLHTIRVGIGSYGRNYEPTWTPEPVPEGFDYDLWLGPAPWAPYHPKRCHYKFRFILDYAGGQMTDWGGHYLDIAQWGNQTDHTGPVEIRGKGEFPKTGLFTTALEAEVEYTYANGVKIFVSSDGAGTRFEGTKGQIYVNWRRLRAKPESIVNSKIGPDEIHLYESRDHTQNFLDCIISRQNPICNAEIGHRSSTVCHLGNIAMILERPLRWNPVAEQFIGDDEANRMTWRPRRVPHRL